MKILMVCLGNICRSPMADGIMRKIAHERGLNIEVDSAGTSDYHIGAAPDKRMQHTAALYGVDISDLQARQFVASDFQEFDLIFGMDKSNATNIIAVDPQAAEKKMPRLILNELYPDEHMEVPDPYYGGDEGFKHVYQLLDAACNKIADRIESGYYG